MAPVGATALHSAQITTSGISRRSAQAPSEDDVRLPYGFGSFQLFIMFGTIVAGATFTLHDESFRLTAGVMDHWCRRPAEFVNLSVSEWKEMAIPLNEDGVHSHCVVRDPPDGGLLSRVVPCKSWEYDLSTYGNNIVSEWDLVCDRRWIVDLARLAYSAACIVSLVVFGVAADHVGRRIIVFVAVPVVLVAGVGGSLPKDLHFFVAVRCVISAAASALLPPLLALMYEVSPMSTIPACTVATWAITIIMVPPTLAAAQAVKGGWAATHLVVMLPTCLLVVLYYTIEESPAWLLVRGRVEEAERIASRAAKMNGLPGGRCDLTGAQHYLQEREEKIRDDFGATWLLCYKRLRMRTTLVMFCWTALAYCYVSFIFSDEIFVSVVVVVIDMFLTTGAAVLVARCVPRFGFKRLVVSSALVFAVMSTTLSAVYTDEETILRNVLLLLIRMAGNVTLMFFIPLAANCYSVGIHCTSLGAGLAFSRLGDTMAQMVPRIFHGLRAEAHLAIASILMTMFAVATQFLPTESDWKRRASLVSARSAVSEATGEELRHMLQDSLVPLPKAPLRSHHSCIRADKKTYASLQEYGPYTCNRLAGH
ncbi:hypothetical protein HPB51_024121 [Rhipicephalus microplus]|uniref:Uncharacterized protein n=1 Tax=Rhipicephalus microplus TaxID=6941 RepID=A0A9J6EEA7_RHIMP|nr:solute carrier family 22 member 6-like [Rhipicephalus microplus]KAH8032344.1 hypothetical protein HPB51_024121 [Rhipicephalus microplus]